MSRPINRVLAGLISDTQPGSEMENARQLPIELIDPDPGQPRRSFDETEMAELTESVKLYGVIQPIGVEPLGERYRIVFGERRYRAARAAGLPEIPAVIFADVAPGRLALITLLENMQRADLDPQEEAMAFERVLNLTGLSQRGLAEQIGKGNDYVSRRVRLLRERPELFAEIRSGKLSLLSAVNSLSEPRLPRKAGEPSLRETAPPDAEKQPVIPSLGERVSGPDPETAVRQTASRDGAYPPPAAQDPRDMFPALLPGQAEFLVRCVDRDELAVAVYMVETAHAERLVGKGVMVHDEAHLTARFLVGLIPTEGNR